MRILSKKRLLPIVLFLLPFFSIAQVNDFERDVKAESVIVTKENGALSYTEINSLNIPNFVVNNNKIELTLNGETYFIDLAEEKSEKQIITKFELNGRILELHLSNSNIPLQVDLSALLKNANRSAATGAFMTTSGVTSNMPGTPSMDDYVFGSETLDDSGVSSGDSRVTYDKSKAAFRAGQVQGTQWDDANRGQRSAAFGLNTTASGTGSFTTGASGVASGIDAVSMGFTNMATGNRSFAAGFMNTASGNNSVGLGSSNMSVGTNSFAAGFSNTANGGNSIALGNGTIASGISSISIGTNTLASGSNSLAGGNGSMAIGNNSISLGAGAKAHQPSSMALGKDADASGKFGFAAGIGTLSETRAQATLGSYNTSVAGNVTDFIATDRLFVIGNGADDSNRSDALVMLKNGNTTLNGTLTINEGGASSAFTLPGSDGAADQIMQTDGSGTVSWVDGGASPWSTNMSSDAYYNSGSVGIGTSEPNSNAALDVASTTGGILFPRMTTADRDMLALLEGLMVYNTDVGKFQGAQKGLNNIIEQSNTNSNFGLGCATTGQSFTATQDKDMAGIGLFITETAEVITATLNIFDGEGMGGTLLHTQSITIEPGISNERKVFSLSAPVSILNGSVYTFQLTSFTGGCPNSYAVHSSNPYAGGQWYFNSAAQPTRDMKFIIYESIVEWVSLEVK